MAKSLRVLHLEGSPVDATRVADLLEHEGLDCQIRRVDSKEGFLASLSEPFDLVLSEYSLSSLSGLEALDRAKQEWPRAPFLFVTGATGEERAIEAVKRGANDWVCKERLSRLGPAVLKALEEKALALEKPAAILQLIARAANEAIWDWDLKTQQFSWNEAVHTLFGHERDHVGGDPKSRLELVHPDDRERVRSGMDELVRSRGTSWSGEYRFQRSDGTYAYVLDRAYALHDEAGLTRRVIGTLIDITERRKEQERNEHLAYHDALTGLPNRTLFKDRLVQALARSRRTGSGLAVLYTDLDQFKLVNDTLGHSLGDELLKAVASRLASCLRDNDTIARVGGDAFVILLQDFEHGASAARVAEKILQAAAEPFEIGEHKLYLTTSIGLSLFPSDGDDAETLLGNADTAMYRAKDLGRNGYQLFTPEMNARVAKRLSMENALRRAIERREFSLAFQPQVSFEHGRVVGFEALLRWDDPARGEVLPEAFIGLAEDTRLIVPIGDWVIDAACRQGRAFHDLGFPDLTIAVNISTHQFQHGDLVKTLERILADTGLDPRLLEIEITESAAVQSVEQTVRILGILRGMGVKIAFDDFGTGYASLGYLKKFPIQSLKIDQGYVRDISLAPSGASIVKAIIEMSHGLGLKVVAEGVETSLQHDFLRKHGCDEFQGYFHSRPMRADHIPALLAGANPVPG